MKVINRWLYAELFHDPEYFATARAEDKHVTSPNIGIQDLLFES